MNKLPVRFGMVFAILLSAILSSHADEPSPGYLDFDGTGRYVLIPQSDDFAIDKNGTLSVTFKVTLAEDQIKDSNRQNFLSSVVRNFINEKDKDQTGFEIYNPRDRNKLMQMLYIWYDQKSVKQSIETNINNTPGREEVHVAFVHDGPNKRVHLYFNGENSVTYTEGAFETKPAAVPNKAGFILGARYVTNAEKKFDPKAVEAFLHGRMDDVRFYRNALTQDDVKADMQSADVLTDKGIIAAYDFSDLSDKTVRDITGNGHDGKLMGDSWPEYGCVDDPDTRPVVEFSQPDGGTLKLFMPDDTELQSGIRVDAGTELTIVVKPNQGYVFESASANDVAIPVNEEGSGNFTVQESTVVKAEFVKKTDVPVTPPNPGDNDDIWPGKLMLNGSDRYMRIPRSDAFSIAAGSSMTICVDVMLKGVAGGKPRMTVLGSRSVSDNDSKTKDRGGFELYNFYDGIQGIFVYNKAKGNQQGVNLSSTLKHRPPFEDMQPHHLALVHDGQNQTVYIYVDGVEALRTASHNFAVPNLADILVGCRNDVETSSLATEYFANGELDNLYFFSTALSPEDIVKLSKGEIIPPQSAMIAGYDFTDVKNREVTDISGNGHTAYLMGASWPEYKESKEYTLTYSVDGEGSLSVTEGGTTVESGSRIIQGKTVTVTPVPAEGHKLTSIVVNGTALDTDGISQSSPVEIVVDSDVNIMAKFAPVSPEVKIYEVSVIADAHAAITLSSESGTVESGTEVAEGTEIKIDVTTADGYKLDAIFLNGEPLESGSFIVRTKCEISVKTSAVQPEQPDNPTPRVKLSVSGNGEVDCNVGNDTFVSGGTVENGEKLTITAKPGQGHKLSQIMINGNKVSLPPGNRIDVTVDGDLDIEIIFAERKNVYYNVKVLWNDNVTFTMRDEVGVFPGHTCSVQDGTEMFFSASPKEGYEIIGVYVNSLPLEEESFIVRGETVVEIKDREIVTPVKYFTLHYMAGEGGVITVSTGDETVTTGSELQEGTEVVVRAYPDEGYLTEKIVVNNAPVDYDESNSVELTISADTHIEAVFSLKTYPLSVVISGHGHAELYREIDNDGNPVATSKIHEGDNAIHGKMLHLFAVPEPGHTLLEASISNNAELRQLSIDEDFVAGKIDRSHYRAIKARGDIEVILRFSTVSSAINAVAEDSADGKVRYYNLHGIEIRADNLTPGIYIKVSGSKKEKILIRDNHFHM